MTQPFLFTYRNLTDESVTAPIDFRYLRYVRDIVHMQNGAYESPEHVLRLPFDEEIFSEVREVARKYDIARLKYVFVIGIGGSNLGTKAVYDALRGSFDFLGKTSPKLIFLDTVSPVMSDAAVSIIDSSVRSSDEILVNLISKSGATTESITNFEFLYDDLQKRFPDISSRIIVTTDRGSVLWTKAEEKSLRILSVPQNVGGRFSIFSAVGLFPLLIAGVNVSEFLKGARSVIENNVSDNIEINDALRFASLMLTAERQNCSMFNIFLFNPELESLGKWERQLIAESIGKEKNLSGEVVHAGMTPIVSIGANDLHSMTQLFLGGPRDKLTMFVFADALSQRCLPDHLFFGDIVHGIGGRHPSDIIRAIFDGVRRAYDKHRLPYADVRLPEVSEFTLGAYMEWRIFTIIYLARLFGVNAFDQPNVEDYKSETRAILENQNR